MPFVKTKASEIHFEWLLRKPESEEAIFVFLHEALGSIPQWKSFPLELCAQSNIPGIIIERSGHGKSSSLKEKRNAQYLHAYANETFDVLSELIPSNPIHLVGHSDGGSIAIILGSDQQVKTITTLAAHVLVEPTTIAGVKNSEALFKQLNIDQKLKKYHGSKTQTLIDAWRETWLSKEFSDWNLFNELRSLSAPILAIQGEKDEYGTRLQLETIESLSQNFRITQEIADCGHHPHLSHKEEVISSILSFLVECNSQ